MGGKLSKSFPSLSLARRAEERMWAFNKRNSTDVNQEREKEYHEYQGQGNASTNLGGN
jgi:hypothetical protein